MALFTLLLCIWHKRVCLPDGWREDLGAILPCCSRKSKQCNIRYVQIHVFQVTNKHWSLRKSVKSPCRENDSSNTRDGKEHSGINVNCQVCQLFEVLQSVLLNKHIGVCKGCIKLCSKDLQSYAMAVRFPAMVLTERNCHLWEKAVKMMGNGCGSCVLHPFSNPEFLPALPLRVCILVVEALCVFLIKLEHERNYVVVDVALLLLNSNILFSSGDCN